jgi:hypothetical protein
MDHLAGYISSVIYLLAQAELFKTVIPDFPIWDMAGFYWQHPLADLVNYYRG